MGYRVESELLALRRKSGFRCLCGGPCGGPSILPGASSLFEPDQVPAMRLMGCELVTYKRHAEFPGSEQARRYNNPSAAAPLVSMERFCTGLTHDAVPGDGTET